MTFVDPGARTPVNIEVRFPGGQSGFDPDALPEWKSPQPAGKDQQRATPENFSADDLPEWKPAEQPAPEQQVSTGQAIGQGVSNAVGFGLPPVLEGLSEASGDWKDPIVGAAKMFANSLSDHPDPEVKKAYERGRERAQKDKELAQEQHPYAFLAGQLGGAVLTPVPGIGAGASLGARLAKGAAVGAGAGAAGGAGEALGEGQDASGIAGRAATGGALGGVLGGAFGGAFGPRVQKAIPTTPGERAAETAANLGAPLPRGLTSDNTAVQATTAKLRSVPIVGSRISSMVDKTQAAAGQRVEDITGQMAGGATDRAAADALVRPALQDVVDRNNARADQLYGAVRNSINPDRPYQLPNTQTTLGRIIAQRQAAGWADPERGLEQFKNVAESGSFNGAHRARVDARNAGNVLNPNPGYNKADYNALTRAMTADLRSIANTEGGQKAVSAFDKAETEFGKMAEQNAELNKLVNARGEGAIATLLGSARERSGNVRLLAQLKNSLSKPDFEQVGGVLLHELAQNPTTGEFSLGKFVTGWDKVSDRAKDVLFSPQHLKDINDIVGMGQHIKSSLRESNTAHTAGVLILFDLARDAALLATTAAAGTLTMGAAAGAIGGLGSMALGRWLASPAKAASMSAWTRAYRAVAGSRTPARIAAFNLATRNLSNNLGVPVETILGHVVKAQPEGNSPEPSAPGPVNH